MSNPKRVMISFAIEDKWARGHLVGQSRNDRTPFEFIDMSVKEPWDEKWKSQCRTRIKGCDGMIAIITKNTANAAGQLWEIQCAKDEGVPLVGMYPTKTDRPTSLPLILNGIKIIGWDWNDIHTFIDSL